MEQKVSRSRKQLEPFKGERVPDSAIVAFITRYPVLSARVYDLHSWAMSYLDVGRFKPQQWRAAWKVYYKSEDVKVLAALMSLQFNYKEVSTHGSHMTRLIKLYREHFV